MPSGGAFLIVALLFGLMMPAAVAVVSIGKGELLNLLPLALSEFFLIAILIFSVRATRKDIGFISHLVLALYPIMYLASALSPYSHRTYVILLIIMPPIVAVLSPRREKLPWLIYNQRHDRFRQCPFLDWRAYLLGTRLLGKGHGCAALSRKHCRCHQLPLGHPTYALSRGPSPAYPQGRGTLVCPWPPPWAKP